MLTALQVNLYIELHLQHWYDIVSIYLMLIITKFVFE